jgi:hypothetical protein
MGSRPFVDRFDMFLNNFVFVKLVFGVQLRASAFYVVFHQSADFY